MASSVSAPPPTLAGRRPLPSSQVGQGSSDAMAYHSASVMSVL
ncbi:hypothetical protein [Streptomyces sp. NPDC001020]